MGHSGGKEWKVTPATEAVGITVSEMQLHTSCCCLPALYPRKRENNHYGSVQLNQHSQLQFCKQKPLVLSIYPWTNLTLRLHSNDKPLIKQDK